MSKWDRFRRGLTQGSRGYQDDRFRSIPLSHFGPLARIPGLRLINSQKSNKPRQAQGWQESIQHWMNERDSGLSRPASVRALHDWLVTEHDYHGSYKWCCASCMPTPAKW